MSLRKYIAVARKYMPPKKTEEQKRAEQAEALVPRKRGDGVNISFPVTTGYPLFWLKRARLSSEISQSEWAGKVSGELTNVSTSPSQIGLPTKLQLKGDFPKQKVLGVDLLATMDHTTENAKESLRLAVASFPVTEQRFSDTADIKFGITQATGGASVLATLENDALTVALQSRFQNPSFSFEAKQKQVQEIVSAVLAGIASVTMNAEVTGSWDKLGISIDSNLGRELSAGFQKQIQAKLAEAKLKLDSFVQEKIAPAKKKAEEQLRALTGGPAKSLLENKTEMDGALKGAEGSAQSPAGASPLNKGKGLLKGFGL